ncbi:MAG: hypothetical protein DMG32_27765 [Acidobacteria bacterium]|nr:MAG: hypothetical protein DMG32_27765 [Acidobacteriota bacterium]
MILDLKSCVYVMSVVDANRNVGRVYQLPKFFVTHIEWRLPRWKDCSQSRNHIVTVHELHLVELELLSNPLDRDSFLNEQGNV